MFYYKQKAGLANVSSIFFFTFKEKKQHNLQYNQPIIKQTHQKGGKIPAKKQYVHYLLWDVIG